jgi:hypothetical protein
VQEAAAAAGARGVPLGEALQQLAAALSGGRGGEGPGQGEDGASGRSSTAALRDAAAVALMAPRVLSLQPGEVEERLSSLAALLEPPAGKAGGRGGAAPAKAGRRGGPGAAGTQGGGAATGPPPPPDRQAALVQPRASGAREEAAGAVVGNPSLLLVPPAALATKLRAMRDATGLPLRQAAAMVTPFMF